MSGIDYRDLKQWIQSEWERVLLLAVLGLTALAVLSGFVAWQALFSEPGRNAGRGPTVSMFYGDGAWTFLGPESAIALPEQNLFTTEVPPGWTRPGMGQIAMKNPPPEPEEKEPPKPKVTKVTSNVVKDDELLKALLSSMTPPPPPPPPQEAPPKPKDPPKEEPKEAPPEPPDPPEPDEPPEPEEPPEPDEPPAPRDRHFLSYKGYMRTPNGSMAAFVVHERGDGMRQSDFVPVGHSIGPYTVVAANQRQLVIRTGSGRLIRLGKQERREVVPVSMGRDRDNSRTSPRRGRGGM